MPATNLGVLFLNKLMKFWFEVPCDFVTVDYGRYEAVCDLGISQWNARFTWTPVLAGPKEPDVLASLSDFEYAMATCPV